MLCKYQVIQLKLTQNTKIFHLAKVKILLYSQIAFWLFHKANLKVTNPPTPKKQWFQK